MRKQQSGLRVKETKLPIAIQTQQDELQKLKMTIYSFETIMKTFYL